MAIEDEVRAKLTSKKSPDRRSAAKKIRKLGLTALSGYIRDADLWRNNVTQAMPR